MNRKEKIVEILIRNELVTAMHRQTSEGVAHAILALPLDMPSDEEISKILDSNLSISSNQREDMYEVMVWMKEEIIKRNSK